MVLTVLLQGCKQQQRPRPRPPRNCFASMPFGSAIEMPFFFFFSYTNPGKKISVILNT